MNKQSREELDAYYREAASWGRDRDEALYSSRRIAWIVAAGAMVVAVLEAVALITLLPLKTVEPYTLMVDRHTGFVQALDPLDPARISGDTALTQSFLVQYVAAREGFDVAALQTNYRKVALWSAETARSSYLAGMQATNPESPLTLYPRTSTVEVRVKSVSPLGRNVAMVRFETQRRDAGGQVQPPRDWAAMIRYRYSGEPMRVEDRFVNPLGFQVLRYRRDAEALSPAANDQSAIERGARTGPPTAAAVPPPAPAPAQPEPQL